MFSPGQIRLKGKDCYLVYFQWTSTILQILKMKNRHLSLLLAWLLIGFAAEPVKTELNPEIAQEHKVKAAFLYRSLKFIDWILPAELPADRTMILGVFGDGPMNRSLESINGRQVKGRKIIVKHIQQFSDITACNILYICAGSGDPVARGQRFKEILLALEGKNILTFSDSEGFADIGGMINLKFINSKVRLEINPKALKEANVRISSKLLRLAKIVEES